MAEIGTAYVKIEPTAKGIAGKISSEMESEGKTSGSSFSKGFGSVIGGVGRVAVGAVAAGATAMGGIVSAAVNSFGEYEQLVGGVETLFGASADEVIKNADRAFQTAGMSANDYMQTVTSFSASLLQSVGGDTAEAAKIADMALIDMSDNANKMGTSMESIQNAYQGFAKQNYTMLDNLKLGYGGTKTEMERLLADAEKLTGVKYDISNLSDVYNAIHAIQENIGITGTTAEEAGSTIQGSLSSVQAAWSNVLTGMATDGANMDVLIGNLLATVESFAGNIMPVVETALLGISDLVTQLAPVLAERLPALLEQALPGLLQAGVQVIESLATGILSAIPSLMPTITDVILQIVQMLVSLAPQLIEVGLSVISELALGIASALPELIPTIVDCVMTITQTLIDNVDLLIDGAIALILGLAEGLINAMPQLIERIPEIVEAIVSALVENAPKLVLAAVELILALGNSMIETLPQLVAMIPQIIEAIVNGLLDGIAEITTVGKDMVEGLWEGIKGQWGKLVENVTNLGKKLVDKVKGFFEIGSPSRLFADEVGKWIPEGIAVGIEANADSVNGAVDELVSDAMVSPSLSMLSTAPNMMAIGSGAVPAVASDNSGVMELLTRFLPIIADELASGNRIEFDDDNLFKLVRRKNNEYMKMNGGMSALA